MVRAYIRWEKDREDSEIKSSLQAQETRSTVEVMTPEKSVRRESLDGKIISSVLAILSLRWLQE